VVYRSRQYWFGNQDPVNTVVRTEIEHVWPGVSLVAGYSVSSMYGSYSILWRKWFDAH